jgi:MGT family glycosyltransferase
VLASLGTHNQEAGARFYRVLLDATGLDLQLVLVAPPEMVGPVPAHILVSPSVPQLELLARCSAVVTHGGVNTVNECLALGLPMVLAPIRDDQPIVAGRVAAVGAGIQVRFGRVQSAEMAAALRSVLGNPAYRAAARRIGDSFVLAGGASAAADHLEKLT